MSKYLQGRYKPTNQTKCITPNKCIYRSSWEYKFMIKLDKSDRVVKWGSEPIKIYYINPLDGKPHRYYPDFYVELSNGSKYILEIKPYKESITPKSNTKTGRARPRKTVLKEHLTYRKNRAKWKYAEAFCKKRGVIFQVITEKELEIML